MGPPKLPAMPPTPFDENKVGLDCSIVRLASDLGEAGGRTAPFPEMLTGTGVCQRDATSLFPRPALGGPSHACSTPQDTCAWRQKPAPGALCSRGSSTHPVTTHRTTSASSVLGTRVPMIGSLCPWGPMFLNCPVMQPLGSSIKRSFS